MQARGEIDETDSPNLDQGTAVKDVIECLLTTAGVVDEGCCSLQ